MHAQPELPFTSTGGLGKNPVLVSYTGLLHCTFHLMSLPTFLRSAQYHWDTCTARCLNLTPHCCTACWQVGWHLLSGSLRCDLQLSDLKNQHGAQSLTQIAAGQQVKVAAKLPKCPASVLALQDCKLQ